MSSDSVIAQLCEHPDMTNDYDIRMQLAMK